MPQFLAANFIHSKMEVSNGNAPRGTRQHIRLGAKEWH